MIEQPVAVLSLLLAVLAGLFVAASRPWGARFFRVVPLLLFAYFVPTALSNLGVIPLQSPIYEAIKNWLLPSSLILLTMSVDLPAIFKLGSKLLILFLGGTVSVVLGGPLAYLALGWLIPSELGEQAWRGMAALSGSWIGGGANFVAVGESVQADDSTIAMMVVVDVALANLWMAVLLFFAGHEEQMDKAIGADRSGLDALKTRIESFQREVARPTSLSDLLLILAIAIGGTAASSHVASFLPEVGGILGHFAWTVILATAIGVAVSLTPLRQLEGAGASKIGSVFLYLLVASIGAKAEFARVAEAPVLLGVCGLWIAIHAVAMLTIRRLIRAPVFYMAVGSQANIGGAASAPIVASAFHPSLAPVGALMGIAGYILGTYGGLMCAFLLRTAARM